MRRYFLAIMCMLFCTAARSQVVRTWQYWFDNNYSQNVTSTFTDSIMRADIDVGHLPDGMHTLQIHVRDTSMKWTVPQSYMFMKVAYVPVGESVTYNCWFDHDYSSLQGGVFGGNILLDVSSLSEGMHTVNVMLKAGSYTVPQSYLFMKPSYVPVGGDVTYNCWFDQDYSSLQDGVFGGNILLDVSSLSEGMHTVNVMLKAGSYTVPQSYMFMKVAQFQQDTVGVGDRFVYHCWFDNDYSTVQTDSLNCGNILLDVADLADGIHTVSVMLEGNSLVPPQSFIFMKVNAGGGTEEAQYHCWFDQDRSTMQTGMVGGGNIVLDVADLADGIHTVNIMFDNGTLSAPQSHLFYKMPVGGVKVTKWEYWLNGNYDDSVVTELDPPQMPFNLLGLIPVETQPIRSSCFKFDTNDGEPVIYAYNEISMRFWSKDRFISKKAMYVDEQVSQDVVAEVFERNTTKQMPSPTDNQIRWFKLDAVVGDSLSFKSDRACTMQLFSPSGEEVYSAQGPQSMAYNGCHALEDGTYYLAVHDATATSSNLNVSYSFIDKYIVMACEHLEVGNTPGVFTIKAIGNGFDKLKSAYLFNSLISWPIDSVMYSTISGAEMRFNMDSFTINGDYDLKLCFEDQNNLKDTLVVNDVVAIVDAAFGTIDIFYDYQASVSEPHIITMTVVNNGNVPYQGIPIYFAYTDDRFTFNFHNTTFLLQECYFEDGGTNIYHTNNLLNKGVEANCVPFVIPELTSHESREIKLQFNGPRSTSFDFYVWGSTPWSLKTNEAIYADNSYCNNNPGHSGWGGGSGSSGGSRGSGGSGGSAAYTIGIPVSGNTGSCASDMFGDFCDTPDPCSLGGYLGSEIAECLCGLALNTGLTLGNMINAMRGISNREHLKAAGINSRQEADDMGLGYLWPSQRLRSPSSLLRDAIGHCTGLLDDDAQHAIDVALEAWGMFDDDCPEPDPQKPNIPAPVDPNDIIGYTSESGSHYMTQEIQKLDYEIEFENDTTLANAAAHTIVVTDTLDATRFDLSSFAARNVTIGSRKMELHGEQSFIYTMDMRPGIDVVAQVQLEYDAATGIARWTMTSLDPMTMEPTTDPYQGILPVNYFGTGVGTVDYSVNLKEKFADGTDITNRACIVFDYENPIMTPKWLNTVDAVSPVSHIGEVMPVADSLRFVFESSDNRSGIWYHTLYYKNDSTYSEWKIKKNNIIDGFYMMKLEDFLTTDYLVIATDSAGNRENKAFDPEYTFMSDSYNYYKLEVLDPLECSEVTGSGTYIENSDVAIEALPSEGYHFEQWNDGDVNNPRIVHLVQDTVFTAQMAINQYLVKVMSEDSIMGSVSGGGMYSHGSNVSVAAMSNPGYKFLYWVESDTIVSDDVVYGFQIKGDRSFMAVFAPGNAQSTMLSEGWNWYSTYIDVKGESGFEMLTTNLGSNALAVKSQTGFSMYYGEYGVWDGSLTTFDNEQMYMIQMSSAHTLTMSGGISDPSVIEFTLQPGWNWISYPNNSETSLDDALATFTPSDGDYLKSQTCFAAYYESFGWDGSLVTLSPGCGFMYFNNSSSVKTLTYTINGSKSDAGANVSTGRNHWQPNVYAYQNNMNITAVVTLDGEELASEDYEVGAFSGDECRGSARLVYNEITGRYVAFMTVYGDTGDALYFKLYDASTDTEYPYFANNAGTFVPNAIVGNLFEPYVVSFSFEGIIEDEAAGIDIYPNPVGVGCEVSLNGFYERVQVVNSMGVVVKEYENVDHLDGFESPGLYIIMISNGKSLIYKKLMVE